ncbi:MAG: acyl-CoA/acyl-ACP dehydrogenase [Deltaproteobacteria bacterium]|nr:acyl-CoA/acyl-ACP dehydrogenase [Deltaproteobacteria bacterium]
MDFGLSEEQEMLQETLKGFAEKECPTTRVRELFDAGLGHDSALWSGLVEMGIAGLAIPEAYGGAGLELLDVALAAEVLGWAGMPGPFLGHSIAALAVAAGGSEAEKKAILPGLASGEAIATVALQEDDRGFAPGDWQTRFAEGRIDGTKTIVAHASIADRILVGVAGGRFAWVDAKAQGITLEDQGGVDRGRPIAKVRFDGAPAQLLSGGLDASERTLDAASVLLAADAFGAATRLIELDVAYSQSRQQFGQPIAQFQAIKHAIARMATEIEPSRGIWWYAAHALDRGHADASRQASIAKAHVTDRAMDMARQSVELHGGYGFTWECEVQMWFKRIMFDRSALGTPEQHRERSARLGGW